MKLNGWKFFSKIDLSKAYLQIPVEEESSKLLCINTHRRLYKFEGLPFGVKVGRAIFQQVMDTLLSGLDFTVAFLEDILMNSKSIAEHKDHVHKVVTQMQNYGFKIKETKCDFFMEKIQYLGHLIDKDGRKPDPDWAATIKDISATDNIASLQSFLGLLYTITIISITTVIQYIHKRIYNTYAMQNIGKYKYRRTLLFQIRTGLLIPWLRFFDTRRETQLLLYWP